MKATESVDLIEQVTRRHCRFCVEADGLAEVEGPGNVVAQLRLAAAGLSRNEKRLSQSKSNIDCVDQSRMGAVSFRASQSGHSRLWQMLLPLVPLIVLRSGQVPVGHQSFSKYWLCAKSRAIGLMQQLEQIAEHVA